MRDRIRKRFQLSVGCFQLSRSARNPVFQIDVEPDDFHLGAFSLADVCDGGDKAGRGAAGPVKQGLGVEQCP